MSIGTAHRLPGSLSPTQRLEVETLASLVRSHDSVDFPLALESAQSESAASVVWYERREQGTLIGIASAGPEDPQEILLIVHPGHRRKGVGRSLAEAIRRDCRTAGGGSILIVAPAGAPGAAAFAVALGSEFHFCEHLLELEPGRLPPIPLTPRNIEIRQVGSDQAGNLAHIRSKAFDDPLGVCEVAVEQWLADQSNRIYLGFIEGSPVGMLRVAAHGDTTFINSFAVLPAHQRAGIGRYMLVHALHTLLHSGVDRIRLEVESDNDRALYLYQSCGFQALGGWNYFRLEV